MSDQARRSPSERFAVLRRLAVGLALLTLLVPGAVLALSPTAPLANFRTEQQAQLHCPATRLCGSTCRPGSTLPRAALVWPDQQRRICVPGRS